MNGAGGGARARLELFARRWWDGDLGGSGRLLSVAATPLSWAWAGASALAALRTRVRGVTQVSGLTVVSVGNLAVGGTGKTPLVAWIAAALRRAGRTPAVLVGGYGGDEARLHERRLPGVPVFVDRDRVRGARRALEAGADVVVLDDAFQHRRVARALDLVLMAAEDAFPGPLLPRGPYREGPRALERATAVVVTRRRASAERARDLAARLERHAPGKVVAVVHLAPGGWKDLEGGAAEPPSGDVLAVCGIGRPLLFRSVVALQVTGSVELVAFEDHHEYTPAESASVRARAGSRPLVTTEKDAMKLEPYANLLGDVRVLSEEVRWDWGEDALRARLASMSPGA